MYIEKIILRNFKCFGEPFCLEFSDGLNVLVGNNEAGKSTILEAIHLVLTGLLNGRYLKNELSAHLFNNAAVAGYIESLKGSPKAPPEILIELFFKGVIWSSKTGQDPHADFFSI